ncbi:MAG TPA: flagellar assembly protein FliH [Allosphingosinicella sp.]|jgi:flagellar assembly protein FliH
MASSHSKVRPFAFERVFTAPPSGKTDANALHAEVEVLQARYAALETAHRIALEEARAEGVEQGLAQARAEREAALLSAIDALQAGVEQIATEVGAEVDRVTREAADFALAAADLLAARALESAPLAAVDEALTRVLLQLGRNPQVQVRVHPNLAGEMQRLVEIRQAGDRRRMDIDVYADATIAEGDALIAWHEGGLKLDAESRRAAVLDELEALLPPAA